MSDDEESEEEDDEERASHYDGRKATVGGRTFDVPSWLTDDVFVKGVTGDDGKNPLSALVSLEHIEESDDGDLGESYHARFLIPVGRSMELCHPLGLFSRSYVSEFDVSMVPEGLELAFDVSAPRDISVVDAHCYPDDAEGRRALSAGHHRITGGRLDPDDIPRTPGFSDEEREEFSDDDVFDIIDVPGHGRRMVLVLTDED